MIFNCPAEALAIDKGSWVMLQDENGDYTTLAWTILLEGNSVPVAIIFQSFFLSEDGTSFSGRVLGFPMRKDLSLSFSLTNAQFISADMAFVKIP
jgi:hypothetical protein